MDIAAQITSVRHGEIRGWAFDRDEPGSVVEVELYADGAFLGLAETCPQADADHETSGAFRLEAKPTHLKLPYTIRLGVAAQPDVIVAMFEVSTAAEHEAAMTRFEGEIVGLRDGAIVGWARDLLFPDRAVALEYEFVAGPKGVLQVSGREDHQAGASPDPWFSLPLPREVLDTKPQTFVAQVSGTNVRLKGSPFYFALTAYEGWEQRLEALEDGVRGLSRLEERVVQDVTRLARELVERSDAMMLLCRNNIERELSAMRRLLGRDCAPAASPVEPAAAEVVFDARLIGIGWHQPEVNEHGTPYRWMGNVASVLVEMSTREPLAVFVKGVASLDEHHLSGLQLYIDDEEIKLDTHVIEYTGWEARCVVPARPLSISPFSTLKFIAPGARLPGNGDSRTLSLAFTAIKLTKIAESGTQA